MRIRMTGLRGSLGLALLLVAGALMLGAGELWAQHEDDKWIFGNQLGLDFSSGKPVLYDSAKINARYLPSASVSDRRTGALLFYTNGKIVWNRQHDTMSNGELFADSLSALNVLVVPDPGDSARYYLFTGIDGIGTPPIRDAVYYSVIDMRANGGLGGVTTRNHLLVYMSPRERDLNATYPAPTFTAIAHCNGSDYWLVTSPTRFDSVGGSPSGIASYLISAQGVAPRPVVSYDAAIDTTGIHRLMGSPDGGYLLVGNLSWVYSKDSWLFRFDRATGRVSRIMTFSSKAPDIYHKDYGYTASCFSPDGSLLYIGWIDGAVDSRNRGVFQFDLCRPDSGTIAASKYEIHHDSTTQSVGYFFEGWPCDIRMGPDGKLYVGYLDVGWLDVIENPNDRGAAVNFRDSAINLHPIHPSYAVSFRQLPTRVVAPHNPLYPCGYRRVCLAHHTIYQCAGHGDTTLVVYNHEDQVDTAISVKFIGEYADNLELATSLPFLLPPTEDIWIPVRHKWVQSGTFATRMQIGTAAGFTYEIMVISHVDSTITKVLGVDTIHLGSHDGVFDTCVAIPNRHPMWLQLGDTVWSSSDGTFAMSFPTLPQVVAPHGMLHLCLHTLNARGDASTRLLLGGQMTDSFGIPHCVAHELVIDTKPPAKPVASAPQAGPDARGASLSAYPNPFTSRLTIQVRLERREHARLSVVDAVGREVTVLYDGMLDAGSRTYDLDASGLPSGLYMVRMDVGGRTTTQMVTLRR